MRNKKLIILTVIFIILVILLLCCTNVIDIQKIDYNIRKSLYGEPIDLETGLINNNYFHIDETGSNPESTTAGINEALNYANKNNVKYIKLKQGHYLINGIGARGTKKGIILVSNIELDLNNSIIEHKANSSERYSIFNITNVENVVICNGKLIGDRENHDYQKGSTHEWGYGIEIIGSTNIKLFNLDIKNMTGDGIMISSLEQNNNYITSSNIQVNNNNIYSCRRQGISIICAKNVKIYDNEIHDISGTPPSAAIDLEPDNDKQLVEDIYIYNNNIYNKDKSAAVQILKNIKKVNIYNNQINGNLSVYGCQDKTSIYNNAINNGNIIISISESQITDIRYINKIEICENKISNCEIVFNNVRDVLINKNTIQDTKINILSSNIAICNNIFDYTKEFKYAYKYAINNLDINHYCLYIFNNNLESQKEVIEENELITIYRDHENLEKYIDSKFNSKK